MDAAAVRGAGCIARFIIADLIIGGGGGARGDVRRQPSRVRRLLIQSFRVRLGSLRRPGGRERGSQNRALAPDASRERRVEDVRAKRADHLQGELQFLVLVRRGWGDRRGLGFRFGHILPLRFRRWIERQAADRDQRRVARVERSLRVPEVQPPRKHEPRVRPDRQSRPGTTTHLPRRISRNFPGTFRPFVVVAAERRNPRGTLTRVRPEVHLGEFGGKHAVPVDRDGGIGRARRATADVVGCEVIGIEGDGAPRRDVEHNGHAREVQTHCEPAMIRLFLRIGFGGFDGFGVGGGVGGVGGARGGDGSRGGGSLLRREVRIRLPEPPRSVSAHRRLRRRRVEIDGSVLHGQDPRGAVLRPGVRATVSRRFQIRRRGGIRVGAHAVVVGDVPTGRLQTPFGGAGPVVHDDPRQRNRQVQGAFRVGGDGRGVGHVDVGMAAGGHVRVNSRARVDERHGGGRGGGRPPPGRGFPILGWGSPRRDFGD